MWINKIILCLLSISPAITICKQAQEPIIEPLVEIMPTPQIIKENENSVGNSDVRSVGLGTALDALSIINTGAKVGSYVKSCVWQSEQEKKEQQDIDLFRNG